MADSAGGAGTETALREELDAPGSRAPSARVSRDLCPREASTARAWRTGLGWGAAVGASVGTAVGATGLDVVSTAGAGEDAAGAGAADGEGSALDAGRALEPPDR